MDRYASLADIGGQTAASRSGLAPSILAKHNGIRQRIPKIPTPEEILQSLIPSLGDLRKYIKADFKPEHFSFMGGW